MSVVRNTKMKWKKSELFFCFISLLLWPISISDLILHTRLDKVFLKVGNGTRVMMRLTGGIKNRPSKKSSKKSNSTKNPTKNPSKNSNATNDPSQIPPEKSTARKTVQMKSVWFPLPFDFLGLNLHLQLRLDGIPSTKEAFMTLMSALYDLLVS